MSLNIKNEQVHRLVEELAHLTGESQTMAVRQAVEEKLARLKGERKSRTQVLARIAHECANGLSKQTRSMTHAEMDAMLYDENGLPK